MIAPLVEYRYQIVLIFDESLYCLSFSFDSNTNNIINLNHNIYFWWGRRQFI
jgi:hypothetical protein